MPVNPGFRLRLNPGPLYARPARRGSLAGAWAIWRASVSRPARRRSLAERAVYAGSRFAPPRAIVCTTRSPRVFVGALACGSPRVFSGRVGDLVGGRLATCSPQVFGGKGGLRGVSLCFTPRNCVHDSLAAGLCGRVGVWLAAGLGGVGRVAHRGYWRAWERVARCGARCVGAGTKKGGRGVRPPGINLLVLI